MEAGKSLRIEFQMWKFIGIQFHIFFLSFFWYHHYVLYLFPLFLYGLFYLRVMSYAVEDKE